MVDEIESLTKNKTWDLMKLPKGKKALHNRWIYRIKDEADGSRRYKARLVVKGYEQKAGEDYTNIFSPVVKLTTIRAVLSLVAVEDLHLEQLDVRTACNAPKIHMSAAVLDINPRVLNLPYIGHRLA